MDSRILSNFYRGPIESILTGCVTVWYGSCTSLNRKALRGVLKTAERITGTNLPSLQDLHTDRCRKRAKRIISDASHPCHGLFSKLPSGRRLRSVQSKTNRFRDSDIPKSRQATLHVAPLPLHPSAHAHLPLYTVYSYI
ncbi:hypothetical protein FQN60_003049 [Etheostoma spectabile]|uniref:Alkylated DNA repair protein AlkB homologue 8 N-terminal domain-containing protein n=2 Tax=Etheostoma spectabile TaxID=54343 RepID=A0A5J5CHZ3_9PERO|nr:hypothetical protein FQN60_003049 [Etheostoma spectabile]